MVESVTKCLKIVRIGPWPVAAFRRINSRAASPSLSGVIEWFPLDMFLGTWPLLGRIDLPLANLWLCFFNLHKGKNIVVSPGRCGRHSGSQRPLCPSGTGPLLPLLLWQVECHRCYFIHLIDHNLLIVLHWGIFIDNICSLVSLNTTHADIIYFCFHF